MQKLLIATRNQGKIEQFSRMLGIPVEGKDLQVPEVQSEDPIVVLTEKAKTAWNLNHHKPILVEDSVLQCHALFNLPGPFVDQFTNSLEKRKMLCNILDGKDRTAIFQVGIAIYDGSTVQYRFGNVKGQIAHQPTQSGGFGFDDIFIPDGQEKTYAQMNEEDRDYYSPRRIVIEALRDHPFI